MEHPQAILRGEKEIKEKRNKILENGISYKPA